MILLAILSYVLLPDTKSTGGIKSGGTVTVEGRMTCLPHRDTSGPQTMECAIGFKADNGDYYGIRSQDSLVDTSGRDHLRVTGSLGPAASSKYQSEGTITVSKIEKLN